MSVEVAHDCEHGVEEGEDGGGDEGLVLVIGNEKEGKSKAIHPFFQKIQGYSAEGMVTFNRQC